MKDNSLPTLHPSRRRRGPRILVLLSLLIAGALTLPAAAQSSAVPSGTFYIARASANQPEKDYLQNVGKGLNLFSAQDEHSLGLKSSGEMNKKLTLIRDPAIQSYVEGIGNRLVGASRNPNLKCQYFVVNTKEVNAFALPGCFVYVNRGLLELAKNESQVAGVMGHEIGHVIGRHGTRQMSKQLLLLVVVEGAGMAAGMKNEKVGAAIQAAGGLGVMLASLKYSRDDEHQADALGAENMVAAGYDPNELIAFFRLMDPAKNPGSSEHVLGLLKNHPLTVDRQSALAQQISHMNYRPAVLNASGFQSCRQRLAALSYPTPSKEVTLSNALAAVGLAESGGAAAGPKPIGNKSDARTVIDIPGTTSWKDTGITVKPGQTIQLWAEGKVFIKKNSDESCDPNGVADTGKGFWKPLSSVNTGALIGRIVGQQEGRPFAVGAQRVVSADTAGKLQVGINDDNVSDNRDSFRVWILTR